MLRHLEIMESNKFLFPCWNGSGSTVHKGNIERPNESRLGM